MVTDTNRQFGRDIVHIWNRTRSALPSDLRLEAPDRVS